MAQRPHWGMVVGRGDEGESVGLSVAERDAIARQLRNVLRATEDVLPETMQHVLDAVQDASQGRGRTYMAAMDPIGTELSEWDAPVAELATHLAYLARETGEVVAALERASYSTGGQPPDVDEAIAAASRLLDFLARRQGERCLAEAASPRS